MYMQESYYARCPKCAWPVFYISDSTSGQRITEESDQRLAFLDTDFDFFEYECMQCGNVISSKKARKMRKQQHFTVRFEKADD